MALAFALQGAGFTPAAIPTEAAVEPRSGGQGCEISKSALTLRAKVPGIDEAKFLELAHAAAQSCRSPRC